VRLVVDSALPLGGRCDRDGRRRSSLEDFAPARPGKGSTASRDPSLAVRALQQGLCKTRRRRRVLSTYLDSSRMVWFGTAATVSGTSPCPLVMDSPLTSHLTRLFSCASSLPRVCEPGLRPLRCGDRSRWAPHRR
jgi:hypothetical protein